MSSLIKRDRQVVWHPYTQAGFGIDPLPVVRAEGSRLILEDGREILDGISSWWCCLHGHGHPVLSRAANEQFQRLDHVLFAGVTHEPAVQLAERLCSVVPHRFQRVFYSDNGSTAVEVAIKLAVQTWLNRGERRPRIVALEGAYHGDTFGAMAAGARSVFSAPFEDLLFSVERLSIDGTDEDLSRCEALCAAGDVSCFIFEPLVQGAGGMRFVAPEVLDAYCERFKAAGVFCIADEVMTGFGRTGALFASSELRIAPDLVCLSKGITSGTLPLAVTMCREDLYQEFISPDHSRTFFHGHTFTANPIACAVALASLDLTLSDESRRARDRIAEGHARCVDALWECEGVRDARCLGTILACDVVTDTGGYTSMMAHDIREFFLEQGVLLRPLGNVIYFMPPYSFTEDELTQVYTAIEELCSSL